MKQSIITISREFLSEIIVENAHLPFCGLRDILTKTERSVSYERI